MPLLDGISRLLKVLESPFVILRLFLHSRVRYVKVPRWNVLSVPSSHPPGSAIPSGNAERAGNSALVLELHLQWVISVLGWDSLCSTPSSRLFRNLCSVSLGEVAVQERCSLSKQCDCSSLLAKALQCSFAFNHLVLLDKWLLRIFPQNLRKCSASHDCRISVKCPQEAGGSRPSYEIYNNIIKIEYIIIYYNNI